LARLQDPQIVIQTASVCYLHKQLTKFFVKHGSTLEFQFEQKALVGLVCTSNLLESKNSIFKLFARIAQSFQRSETCEWFWCGVALMENFDVKQRGLQPSRAVVLVHALRDTLSLGMGRNFRLAQHQALSNEN